MGHHVSRSKVGVILRQPCGSSSQQPAETFPPMHFALGARMLRLGTYQCIGQTLVVALAMVMRHEFSTRFPHRALAEQDHPLQAGFLDRPCFLLPGAPPDLRSPRIFSVGRGPVFRSTMT